MSSFLFAAVSLNNFSAAKTYYFQAVATVPSVGFTVISQIVDQISTPQVLTGATFVGQVLSFPDQSFTARTYSVAHVGFVMAERVGAAFAGTDPLVAFVPHLNSSLQPIVQPVGTYAISLDFAAAGFITIIDAWQYQVGAYTVSAAALDTIGLFALIGTKNNTVAYVSPATSTPVAIETFGTAGTITPSLFVGTSSVLARVSGQNAVMMRFRNNADVSFGANGQFVYTGTAGLVKIYGSNNLKQGWSLLSLEDDTNWTEICNITNTLVSPLFSTNGTFYRFFKLAMIAPSTGILRNGNFFGCTIRTPNENFN
jgi:hypothetical protein